MRRVFYAYIPPAGDRSTWVRPRFRSVLLLASHDAREYSEASGQLVFVMAETEGLSPTVIDAYLLGRALGRNKAQERYAALKEQEGTENARR